MKKYLTILLLLPFYTQAQTASAGNDITVYLNNGNSATLDGSASSATSYLWREISTDYMSGATITTPTSKTTTVTGLPQGVFYFELAATTGPTTVRDTVVVRVLSDYGPPGGTLREDLPMKTIWPGINARNDTTNYIGYVVPNENMGDFGHNIVSERGRLPEQQIDTLRGKLKNTIEDGYAWNSSSYARSEAYIGSSFFIDSNKVYDIRWQGYFPQDSFWLDQSVSWAAAVVIMQIHGTDPYSPPFGFNVGYHGNLFVGLNDTLGNPIDSLTIGQYRDFVNKAHSIEVIWKESKTNGFVRVKVDGVTKFFYTGAQIGRPNMQDFFKFGSVYDYGNRIVNVTNHTRNRKWSLITEQYQIYQVSSDIPDGALPTNITKASFRKKYVINNAP